MHAIILHGQPRALIDDGCVGGRFDSGHINCHDRLRCIAMVAPSVPAIGCDDHLRNRFIRRGGRRSCLARSPNALSFFEIEAQGSMSASGSKTDIAG
jgi:hypothetical protein